MDEALNELRVKRPLRSIAAEYWPAALGGLVFVYLLLMPSITPRLVDFPVYYEAGQKAIEGRSVYDVTGHFQYKYSPLFAWIFGGAFSLFDLETAARIWHGVSLAGILGLFLVWARFFRIAGSPGVPRSWVLGLGAFAFFPGAIKFELQLGQMNVIPVALMTGFILLAHSLGESAPRWRVGREILAALLLAMAIHVKLFALVAWVVPLMLRQWRLSLLVIPVFCMSLVPLLAIHGPEFAKTEYTAWLSTLTASTGDLLPHFTNVGLLGTLARVTPSLTLAKLLWIVLGAAFAGLWWIQTQRDRRFGVIQASLGLTFFTVVLFNPLVWSYWVWFLGPVVLGIFTRGRADARTVGILALSFIAFHAQSARISLLFGIPFGIAGLLYVWLRSVRRDETQQG